MAANQVHPFERAGLGLAPFRLVGHSRRVGPIDMGNGYSVGAPGQPMGTCDYCGTGIADCFHIRSSDGKTFIVGSDCVMKTSRESATGLTQLEKDVRQKKNDLAREKRDAKRQAQLEVDKVQWDLARDYLAANPDAFKDRPHPTEWLQRQGMTLRDYFEWMLARAGQQSRNEIAARILGAAK